MFLSKWGPTLHEFGIVKFKYEYQTPSERIEKKNKKERKKRKLLPMIHIVNPNN